MDCISNHLVISRSIQGLIGKPLRHAIKSPDTDLYDFGFGERIKTIGYDGIERVTEEYFLHALCPFRITWRNDNNCSSTFSGNTPDDRFRHGIASLLGLAVKEIAIVKENNLLLDFGTCYIIFFTNNDGEESWRIFTPHTELPHVVATNLIVDLE